MTPVCIIYNNRLRLQPRGLHVLWLGSEMAGAQSQFVNDGAELRVTGGLPGRCGQNNRSTRLDAQ